MRILRRPTAGCPASAALALAAALIAGCSSRVLPTSPPLPPLSRVVLAIKRDTLAVGGSQFFTATAYDTNHVAVPGAGFSWTSTDPAVCTVTPAGLVTAVAEGVARIIAAAGGKADTANIYVKAAQTGWYTQTSGTANALNAVCFLSDGHTGFAVGAQGTMVTTTDAGATWAPHASGVGTDLTSIWFSSPTVGWAVGSTGVLVQSTDAGVTWQRRTNMPTAVNLNCVRFADPLHGWVVGAGGWIARTVDGGATWTGRSWDLQPFYGVSFCDTTNGWAVGAGIVYGTHDGGASWYKVLPSLTAQTLRSVWRVSNQQACGVGAQGTVVTAAATVDSLAWTLSSVGAAYVLTAVQMTSATNGWAVGANPAGAVLVTTDGGVTWTPQVSSSAQPLNGVYFADGLRGWAVGALGRIVHTSSGGAP